MRCIIAGSRDITDIKHVERAMQSCSLFHVTEIVSGGARGVDRLGERWARNNDVTLSIFPALWDKYGKKAGYIRNKDMAEYADMLVAVWDGKSTGTKHMIDIMESMKKFVFVYRADTSS